MDILFVRVLSESFRVLEKQALRFYYPRAMNEGQTFFIETFGCQMNVHDSEKLAATLRRRGWRSVRTPASSDVIILNTCAVRMKAEQKVFSRIGRLRRLKRRNGRLRLVVAGCMAQIWGYKLRERFPEVDIITGPGAIDRLPEYIHFATDSGKAIIDTEASNTIFELDTPTLAHIPKKLHAWVTIMEGCDNFCSYCIVPYVRGRERSRPASTIISEVKQLTETGVREITLLGQNVNSYHGIKGGFPELLYHLNKVDGLLRIRFTTSHPKDVSDALIQAMAELPKVCEYLHFPAQSGSTRVLRRMKRGYTREQYLDKVRKIRKAIPGAALSSDIIIGFPGETESDYQDTKSLLETVRFEGVFAFRYSPRSMTRAAQWEDDVPEEVKSKRLTELISLQRKISMELNEGRIGSKVEVLMEGAAKRGAGLKTGRTRGNRIVNFKGPGEVGHMVQVKVESVSPNCLYGLSCNHEM